jgi:tetratricopeptide (TPR) repeat protein
MSTSFKLFFGDNNIRRISVDSEHPSYSEITNLLHNLYEGNYHPELFIKWKDEEGDLITVSSQPEWDHLINTVTDRPIKLYITEGQAPYFKDGPPAEPKYFYSEDKEELKTEPEFLSRLKHSVPDFLQRLFKGERILPYNIPEWLEEAINVKKLPGFPHEVDLDVDIPKLFNAMHIHALKLLGDAKNQPCLIQARQILKDMLEIVPKHAVTLYNLSCVESLLGNIKESIEALRNAIYAGYNNLAHMEKDEDLNNIRETPQYQDLVQTLKKVEEPAPKEETIVTKEAPKEEKATPPKEEPIQVDSNLIEDDWTQVNSTEEKPAEPILSVGEQKWKDSIELLRGMGFGNQEYFGPRCVALLEKHQGDICSVITELLK